MAIPRIIRSEATVEAVRFLAEEVFTEAAFMLSGSRFTSWVLAPGALMLLRLVSNAHSGRMS